MLTTVGDIMTRQVVTAAPETPYKQLVRLLQARGVNALPVVDERHHPVGVVSATDLAMKEERRPGEPPPLLASRREHRKARGTTAADCMSAPPVTVGAGTSVGSAARLLHRRHVHHLLVTDPVGRLIGVVTRRDLLRVFLRPDADIQRQVVEGVLDATLNLRLDQVEATVRDGVVTLAGRVDRRSEAEDAAHLAGAVEGVVAVESGLTWDLDDTRPTAVSPWG